GMNEIDMFPAFGKLLDDIHVTLAHLEKKRTRLQLYTKVDEEKDGVAIIGDAVRTSKRRRQDFCDGVRT
ncbi:hypothetical protein Tco_0544970, partial [Tanacetum coccineum]